jgi:hypothetical protein
MSNIPAMIDEYLDFEQQATEIRRQITELEESFLLLYEKSKGVALTIAQAISDDQTLASHPLIHKSRDGQLFLVEVDEEWQNSTLPVRVEPLIKLCTETSIEETITVYTFED